MLRSILGFHPDPAGDWVAELSCPHNQHIRHRPPFQVRAWVLETDGRTGRLGSAIECPLCDRADFPDGLAIIRRAGPWDQDSVPPGLLRAHRTSEGRWGRLRVLEGEMEFQFESESASLSRPLRRCDHQPIPPGAAHRVVLIGPVRFDLEFWGRPVPDCGSSRSP